MGDEDWSQFYELFGIDPGDGEAVSQFTIDGLGGPPSDLDEWVPPTEGGDGLDWKFPTGLNNGGSGMNELLKFLGMTGKGGVGGTGINIMDLLAGGAGLWGTLNKNNATKESTKMLQEAAEKGQAQARELIGGAAKNFQPYIDTGAKANQELYDMVGKNALADRYKALDVDAAMANIPKFKPIKISGLTLADLAKRK